MSTAEPRAVRTWPLVALLPVVLFLGTLLPLGVQGHGGVADHLAGPATATGSPLAGLQRDPAGTGDVASWESLGADEDAELRLTCPEPEEDAPRLVDTGGEVIVYGCPIRIYDRGYGFGSMQLAEDPRDPDRIAFVSLHGAAADNGSERARTGETHTVFTTEDGGLTWQDSPFPAAGVPEDAVGEEHALAYDAAGRLHVAYLWRAAGPDGTDTVGLYTVPADPDAAPTMAYAVGTVLGPRHDDGRLSDLRLVAVPPTEGDPGNVTVHALWREQHDEPVDGNQSRLDGATLTLPAETTPEDPARYDAQMHEPLAWTPLPENATHGCDGTSDAVAHDGHVVVACRDPSRSERVTLVAVTPDTLTSQGQTTMAEGRLRLAMTHDGYTALTSTSLASPLDPRIDVRFGWSGDHWSEARSIGADLHRMAGDAELADAAVTGLALSPSSQTAFLVYHQRVAEPGVAGEYQKVVAAFDACTFPVAASRPVLGTAMDPINARHYADAPGMFADTHDGLTITMGPNGTERVRFALNDYGAAQFGAFVAASGAGFCATPPPAVPSTSAPVPEPLTEPNTMQNAVGGIVGLFAAAMVGYLLTTKRRDAQAADVEA